MHWIIVALLTSLSYGLYNFFIKLSSGNIHQILGAVILQVVATVGGVLALLTIKSRGIEMPISPMGIRYAVLAGVFVGLAEILSFYFFSLNISASRGIPIIIGGSVAFGTILGVLFLDESLSVFDWLGIALIIAGVVLLSARGEQI